MSWFKIRPVAPKNAPKLEVAVEETLQCEHFQVAKVVRHGFPYQPTALAFDPVQNLLAIGTKSGSIRLIGRPGVDCHIKHEADFAVIQIMFLINEGALVSVCADDQLHLWSLRQKRPEIIHALKFQKERITFCHLPFQSKWLYIGTQKGNVHVLNLESFVLSGYIINWNKTIELIRRTHPGPVVHLSANQSDPSKLLIGYETGLLTLWDLKNKSAEFHYNCKETLKFVSWHHEGKQFICCHGDGSLTTWNVRSPQQPASTIVPHGKLGRDGKPETCRPINKVELCTNKNSEPFTIFSGGMPAEKVGQTPTLTIMHGSNTTVLEMEYQIIDFAVLCSTPWNNDFQDPYAVIVLLQNDFVVLDLTSPNYPCFENPCPMDIHESPVTACCYFANCPSDLMPAFYSVGYRQKKTGFSDKEWPVKGGEWPAVATSYEEIVITGHADGSLKFWNAPGVTLQVLYKLKTAKMFDDSRSNSVVSDSNDAPYAVHIIRLCVESRLLCVAGLSYVTLFRYNKQEASLECAAIEVTLMYDISDGFDSPENEFSSLPTSQNSGSNPQNLPTCVRLKTGQRKWSAGYQPDLCCMLTWFNGEPPSPIASIAINSKYGLLALGNEAGLAIVDILQKTCLLNIGTPDLYGSMDPHSRAPRSPKLKSRSQGFDSMTPDDIKSPNFEQHGPTPPSPTHPKPVPCHPRDSAFKAAELTVISESSLDVCEEDSVTLPQHNNNNVSHAKEKSPSSKGGPPKRPEVSDAVRNLLEQRRTSKEMVEKPAGLETAQRRTSKEMVEKPAGLETAQRRTSKEMVEKPVGLETAQRRTNKEMVEKPAGLETAKAKETQQMVRDDAFLLPLVITSPDARRHSTAADALSLTKQYSKLRLNIPQRDATTGEVSDLPLADPEFDQCNSSYPFAKRSPPHLTRASWSATGIGYMENTSDNCVEVPHTAPVMASKPDGFRLVGKVNRKLKQCLKVATGWRNDRELLMESSEVDFSAAPGKPKSHDITVVDLTSDDVEASPSVHKLTYAEFLALDRTEGATFSRSQSSSTSSLDNIIKEAVQCLTFGEVFARKSDNSVSPCLWAGTSLGSVLVLSINLPPDVSTRRTEAVSASPTGTVFRLKGGILAVSFLDSSGILIPSGAEPWRDLNREDPTKERRTYTTGQPSSSNIRVSTSVSASGGSDVANSQQFAVLCSEKQARVVALPSQTCTYKVKITETSSVVRADAVAMKDSSCLACYLLSGRILTFSLPSLKPLLDVDLVSSPDVRVARTLCFSCNCNNLYFCSPSELQKITLSADMCENLMDMLGELFIPCDMPEPPKQSIFKNLFSAGSGTLDREELFGERSGKPGRGVAKYMSGISQTQDAAGLACSEIGRAKMAAIERGEKLGELEERTTQMMMDAEVFSQRANQIKNKYKDRKWYQF